MVAAPRLGEDMFLLLLPISQRSASNCRPWAWNGEALRLSRVDIPRVRATAATCAGLLQAYRDRLGVSLHFLMEQNSLLAFCSKRA